VTDQRWYFTKTLMGYGPGEDRNRRILYDGSNRVAIFNMRMHDWHPEDEEALHKVVNYLNSLERLESAPKM
jgi:hypothetical protein